MLLSPTKINTKQIQDLKPSTQDPKQPSTENTVESNLDICQPLSTTPKRLHTANPGLCIAAPRPTPHISASNSSAETFVQQLEQITDGLTFTSETDLPYQVFRHSFSASELDPETFREALNISNNTEIHSRSIDDYFNLYQTFYEYPEGSMEPEKYQALETLLRSNLNQLQVIYVGGEDVVEGDVYIVGLDQNGKIMGLKTGRVWT